MARGHRYGRRLSRAVLAAMAALVLLVGVLRANARYFYCPFMGAVASHSCCAAADDASTDPVVEAPDCCEVWHVGSLPTAAGASSIEVAASPLVATVPRLSLVAPRAPLRVRAAALEARRRAPPLPSESRARAMVFLI